jgi:phage tail-like protein
MAQTGQRDDPYLHYNFMVEIDGVQRAGFMEAGLITTDTDPIDYREGTDVNLNVRKLTGLRKYTPLVLKRGYTQNKELWLWRKDIINGIVKRRSVEVILLDETRQAVLRWQFREAWISKWESGPFNAKTNEVTIESVELTHEGAILVE